MKSLSPRGHALCDLVLVSALVAGPAWLGFEPTAALTSLALAAIWLAMTLLTASPLGLVRQVPLAIHGIVELALSLVLVVAPWLADFARHRSARNFFVISGVLLFAVWLLTDYATAASRDGQDDEAPRQFPTIAPRR